MDNIENLCKEYKELQRMQEELSAELDAVKDAIRAAMAGAETVTAGAFKVSDKVVTSSRFDSTRFKKDHADLAVAYTKTTTTRRFIIA